RHATCLLSLFARHADHRDLPSFPTRRSSDLRPPTSSRRDAGAPGSSTPIRAGTNRPNRAWISTSPPRGECGGNTENRERGRAATDRKSTRLNSSHVKISYAVFCLKKKKHKKK